jgi:hypothetical protein
VLTSIAALAESLDGEKLVVVRSSTISDVVMIRGPQTPSRGCDIQPRIIKGTGGNNVLQQRRIFSSHNDSPLGAWSLTFSPKGVRK